MRQLVGVFPSISSALTWVSRVENSFSAVRFTSAKRTWSITCTAGGAIRLSITVAPEVLAISMARATEFGSFTAPLSATEFPLADTSISSWGKAIRM